MQLFVDSVTKRIGRKTILRNISFGHHGGILGIAGPNGSGKSTLMKCLSGLLKPSSGTISWYDGQQPFPGDIKERLGFAAPYITLYPELTPRENLRFVSQLRALDRPEQLIDYWLEEIGVAHRADVGFGALSSGQQQRVRLASAMLHEPAVLFFDEPGTNLDEQGRNVVQKLLRQAKNAGVLVVLASNLGQELALCDRTIQLEAED